MYPIFLQMIQSDKRGIQHPLTLNMKPFQISKYTWNISLKTTPTNHFLETPPCLKKTSTAISLPKKKRASPSSPGGSNPTGGGKAWRWTFRQVSTRKRIYFPPLGSVVEFVQGFRHFSIWKIFWGGRIFPHMWEGGWNHQPFFKKILFRIFFSCFVVYPSEKPKKKQCI